MLEQSYAETSIIRLSTKTAGHKIKRLALIFCILKGLKVLL